MHESEAHRRPSSASPSSSDVERRRRRLESLANLMDSSIAIPGTNFKFGVDPLIGLVPGVGDVVTTAISLYIVHQGWKIGATRGQVGAMLVNVLIDFVLGEIPIAGDVGDFFFKANVRNLKILGITPRGVKIEIDPGAPFRGEAKRRAGED